MSVRLAFFDGPNTSIMQLATCVFFAILVNVFRMHTGVKFLGMNYYNKWSLASAIFLLDAMVLYYWSRLSQNSENPQKSENEFQALLTRDARLRTLTTLLHFVLVIVACFF